jgi:hypothetical protein
VDSKRQRRAAALWAIALVFVARAAAAQQTVSDVLSFLMTNQAVVTSDFVKDRQAAEATRDTIFRLVQVELGALPISSSSGGFIYKFNPSLGTLERASDSFGPTFVERALTSGRGQTAFSLTYRHYRFDTLDGQSLKDGGFVTTANRLAAETQPFDVERLRLRIAADTVTIFGSYGVTDRLDVGAAVPIVDLRLSGDRVNTYRGTTFQQATGSAAVTGIADVAVRAKYHFLQTDVAGVAVNSELRLPTGAADQFLGAGRAAIALAAITSLERDRIGAHLKAGFTKGGASDAVDYGAALVVAAAPHFNIEGEVFGHRLSALSTIGTATVAHPLIPHVETTRLLPVSTGTNTMLGLAGCKWNIARTWLLSANVLFPLTDEGLTGRPTPSIALDYTFDRR